MPVATETCTCVVSTKFEEQISTNLEFTTFVLTTHLHDLVATGILKQVLLNIQTSESQHEVVSCSTRTDE